jgi:thioredoxin 1
MNNSAKVLIVVALAIAVVVVIALKRAGNRAVTLPGRPSVGGKASDPRATDTDEQAEKTEGVSEPRGALPRLVDLGSAICIPCKMMAPILEELRKEYAGRLQVDFIDVRDFPAEARRYNIRVIPTQIFFDASGKERFRHEGFFSKQDILMTWKRLGVDLEAAPGFSRLDPLAPDTRPAGGVCTWGFRPMCALGVAARRRRWECARLCRSSSGG